MYLFPIGGEAGTFTILTRLSAAMCYVLREYIGTVADGISSPPHCGQGLNRCSGVRPVLLTHKPLRTLPRRTLPAQAVWV